MVLKIPHACLVCGMPFGAKFGLCPHCAPKLFALREPTARTELGLETRSLFAWEKNGWPAHRSIIKKLKGHEDPGPWMELAAWMVQVMEAGGPGGRERHRVFVPVPSLGKNHALGWGRALAYWTGWPVADVLRKVENRQNKVLNRFERGRLRFERSDVDLCTKYTDVVIVDDIITTGATARAAYQALGRPRNCEVWCLMDRRPWQGEGSLL